MWIFPWVAMMLLCVKRYGKSNIIRALESPVNHYVLLEIMTNGLTLTLDMQINVFL